MYYIVLLFMYSFVVIRMGGSANNDKIVAVIAVHLIMVKTAIFLAIVVMFFLRRKCKSKKRKFGDAFDDQRFLDILKENLNMFDQKLGELVELMSYKSDSSVKRRALIGELEKIPGLDGENKIRVARRIADKDGDLDLFFGIPEEARAVMVKMILDGEY